MSFLRIRRRRLAGAERGSCISQGPLDLTCGRVRAAEHAPRGRFNLLERIYGLAKIVERGGRVRVERRLVTRPHSERVIMRRPKDASRNGQRFARQRLCFFEAHRVDEPHCIAERFSKGFFMCLAIELQASGVDFSLQKHGLLMPSKRVIRVRKIALHGEKAELYA